ncbi:MULTISPECIES: 3-keto-disaccharide hydrolase [Croceitalea]|uniref:DUF1080 domain-containing protein n=1 Tax=Croceitalea vernalis TaxID=3075599 RepID=A0ABU3BEW0_9FLAO|nr:MULTISPECIES: DUF1080 domain-containing protein [unclassified Croceitalea]MDT0538909.1 DUF1080 domain-containing protein [Croceitalea sp. P059]MDT0620696.1 DUF1080 domain-containing protein [Croceitalea sp. P007]
MKKLLGLMVLSAVFFGCKETNSAKVEVNTQVVSKMIKEEPTKPEETEIYEPVPPKVTVGENGVPSDAIVLFDGTSLENWIHVADSSAVKWLLNEDGSMTVKDKTGSIQTKQNFGSVQLHVEWKSPAEVQREGQNRANSGVFLQNRYEVQVLDNNDNDTYVNGQVGSIYKQSIPLAMASKPSGEWNSYDIIYHAPEFAMSGDKLVSGTITVIHNGVLIQDHYELEGTTEYIGWPKNAVHGDAPIQLQDHQDNSRVSYRNIWVRALD